MRIINILFVVLIFIISCSKEPEKINFNFKDFDDPYGKYGMKVPDNWIFNESETAVKFFSSQDAYNKFIDPAGTGALGAVFSVAVRKVNFSNDLAKAVELISTEEKEVIPQFDKTESIKISGKDAKLLTYRFKVTDKLVIDGMKYIAVNDSDIYHLDYKVFHEVAESYKPAFDTMINSFMILTKQSVGKGQTELPSEKFDSYNGQYFSISYPNNFNTKFPKSQFLFSGNFVGLRQDCNLQVDVFSTKGSSVEKVFEQNKAKYAGARSQGEKQISGLKGLYLNYSMIRNINSRAYFVVKGDKAYRITMNWFTEEEKNYLPVFEKMINSLSIK